MSARLHILSAGPAVSVQDPGRHGFLRFGITPAGPMDADAFLAAALAAGDAKGAAIEVSLGGLELAVEGAPVGLAVAGGVFDVSLEGRGLPSNCALTLHPGQRLALRAGKGGAWCYVAPFARFDLPRALGSLATHARSKIGGFCGRALQKGDAIGLVGPRGGPEEPMALVAPWLAAGPRKLRVLLGPQDDYFAPETIETFLSACWRLSPRSDRMAYRLEGPPLPHPKGHDIVSDGIAFGAIQVPGDGAPLALMADRQPTGGYPKIAHVIGADLPALAQKRPGDLVQFERVSWEQAVAARRARAIGKGVTLAPPTRREFSAEFLLERNLIGGVTDGREG